jgi:hypothetical protein
MHSERKERRPILRTVVLVVMVTAVVLLLPIFASLGVVVVAVVLNVAA